MSSARTLGQQSLPVGTLPPDFDGVPLDGAQYLAMVRKEAEEHPRVMVASKRPAAATSTPKATLAEHPDTLPSREWRAHFVEHFKRLRQVMDGPAKGKSAAYPRALDEESWYFFVHGRPLPSAEERKKMLDDGSDDEVEDIVGEGELVDYFDAYEEGDDDMDEEQSGEDEVSGDGDEVEASESDSDEVDMTDEEEDDEGDEESEDVEVENEDVEAESGDDAESEGFDEVENEDGEPESDESVVEVDIGDDNGQNDAVDVGMDDTSTNDACQGTELTSSANANFGKPVVNVSPDNSTQSSVAGKIHPTSDNTSIRPPSVLERYGYNFKEPTMSIIQPMTTDDVLFVLNLFRRWLTHPVARSSESAVHPAYTRWILSLLARLDSRLCGEEIATLRSLVRRIVACVRNARNEAHNDQYSPTEASAWMVVASVIGVWGQWDLWDEARTYLNK
ncbi:hypothetical protein MCUN1_003634 [Malassezia cuniculi]|uniref:Uncharacterized protein n=1 Tax=Malassezia cuniculi TaxID=948313 RepID=A0AAF0J7L2_9BASI|nr:hypothetical protein MCUN1_003634 [Malassezia cuniculi]